MDKDTAIQLLNQRYELEHLISRISSAVVVCTYQDLDTEIENSLQLIADFTRADRCYLFQIWEETHADNTHEWCAPGIKPQKAILQNMPLSDRYLTAQLIKSKQIVNFPDVAQLTGKAFADKELLVSQSIQSMLSVPMISNTRLVGFIGLDAVNQKRIWSDDDIYLLRIVGDIFTHALEHKRATDMLKASEARLRYIFEKIPAIAVQGYDANRRVFLWNKASEQLYGYTLEEALGQQLENLIIPSEDRSEVKAAIVSWLQGNEEIPSGELTLQRKDGSRLRVFSSHVMHTTSVGQKELYCVDVDLTALKAVQQELKQLAHFDALTSLPNRTLLADRLNQMLNMSRRHNHLVAVAYLDLDGFKHINDTHGHNMGDLLLKQLAQSMQSCLREDDTLARIGGDEFIAVLGNINVMDDCELLMERLLEAASSPVILDGHSLKVSASIGVTLYPLDESDPDQLIRHADQAMYLAKQAGKNRFQFFDIQLEDEICKKQRARQSIAEGLEREEFVLYYQPKINMRTLTLEGAEVLVRWQHPQLGLLSPGIFLPVTEGHELGIKLGEWVINTALMQMQTWKQQGFDCPLSINVAAQQIQLDNFSLFMQSALAAHPRVNAEDVELEILETSALSDIEQVTQIMLDCRRLGVSFSLDDFGTGYSSLAYLKRLPIECLKIDQSFVRDMLTETDDLSIIQGILSLAAAFNLRVIAEGVETPAHCRKMLALGCELAQGYGIARPMPADALPDWVSETLPLLSF
ncbi:sensor domain-containing phosphodiesterase [Nitrincola sp. A-D6]|uniref:sensor domain-containing phosphodiesterase n=1 Tax=Nitrincola sp. A-D6 TaxID=1545442 RepID=UPI0009DD9092|nr:EAL domain-containing protein [Nitrincola sp. A-D6]